MALSVSTATAGSSLVAAAPLRIILFLGFGVSTSISPDAAAAAVSEEDAADPFMLGGLRTPLAIAFLYRSTNSRPVSKSAKSLEKDVSKTECTPSDLKNQVNLRATCNGVCWYFAANEARV